MLPTSHLPPPPAAHLPLICGLHTGQVVTTLSCAEVRLLIVLCLYCACAVPVLCLCCCVWYLTEHNKLFAVDYTFSVGAMMREPLLLITGEGWTDTFIRC
jgi:hypothetical protein